MSLERIGKMTVEVVSDPLQAIEAIKAFRPELVMLDWMMPGMDGPTLFRKMKELPEVRELPVVFITAKASQPSWTSCARWARRGRSPSLSPPATCPSSCARSGASCPRLPGLGRPARDRRAQGPPGSSVTLVELARQEADDLVGVAEARFAVLLQQLVEQPLVALQFLRAAPAAAY